MPCPSVSALRHAAHSLMHHSRGDKGPVPASLDSVVRYSDGASWIAHALDSRWRRQLLLRATAYSALIFSVTLLDSLF